MEKVTFTPAEFAEVFGKERTWGYRQLYAGKVKAITELGRTMIPKSEVDRLLGEAGRYLGSGGKSKKTPKKSSEPVAEKPATKRRWVDVARASKGVSAKTEEPGPSSSGRKAVFKRLAR